LSISRPGFTACLGHAISQSYGAEPFCFVNVIALQEAAEWLFDMAGCLGVFVC
jgi:hypothetical protein